MIPNSRKLRNEPHRLLRHFPSCHGLSKYDPPGGLSKNGTGQDVCNFLQIPQNITCGSSDPVIYDLPFVWVRAGTILSLKGLHMSKAFLLSCVLITGYVAFLAVSLPDSKKTKQENQSGTAAPSPPQSDLEGFLQSLDPDSVRKCLQRHQRGRAIDSKTLLQCGDFSLYAKHQWLPEQYAVGHFKNILIKSSNLNSLRAQLQESSQLVVPVFKAP
ncbi:MAG: hypothetical protein ACR2OA_06490 [Rubripirellula sp.]